MKPPDKYKRDLMALHRRRIAALKKQIYDAKKAGRACNAQERKLADLEAYVAYVENRGIVSK
jgi:hypothetical protein